MRFQVSKEALITPLSFVNGAVERRQTLPVLANVLLSVENNKLQLIGTDLELELRADVSLVGDNSDGEITVPAKKLLDVCKSLPEDQLIEFSVSGNKATIKSGTNKFSLSTLPATEFPNIDESASLIDASLPQSSLRQIIEKTAFAMAQNDVRYYLNGLLVEFHSGHLVAVATDGHRLAMSKFELESDIEALTDTKQAILPRKGVMELLKLIKDEDSNVSIGLGTNHFRAVVNGFVFITKLIDGKFPDYNRVVPRNNDKSLTADRLMMKDALARASILCNEKFRGVRLQLSQGSAHIQANNPEQEEADIQIDVDYSGPEMEVGFNVSYLLDVLNSVDGDQVSLLFADANSSLLVEEDNISQSAYVIMPMRL